MEEAGPHSDDKAISNGVEETNADVSMSIAPELNGAKDASEDARITSSKTTSTSTTAMNGGSSVLYPAITTWQWLFSASDMQYTPSVLLSHMPPEQEKYCRWKGVQMIFRIGEYMRVGNHVTSTASIFFQRFFMRRALVRDPRERGLDSFTLQEMAPTCIFLACKVEEYHRKLHGIIQATMAVLDRSPAGLEAAEARTFEPDEKSDEYRRWKELILLYEERLLETLCFDLIIEHPHPIAIKACKRLNANRDMAQLTVVLLNILLYGSVCTFYDAATLAAGAFQKACNLVEVDPTSYTEALAISRSWYDAFDVEKEEVDEAMPDIDDQIAYHNERLNSMVPAPQQHASSNTGANTPTVHKSSAATPKTVIPAAASASPLPLPQTTTATATPHQVQFASQVEVREAPKEEESMNVMTNDDVVNNPTAASLDEAAASGSGSELQVALLEEHRTDPSRPISRHGGRGANLVPPPPLSMPLDTPNDTPKSDADHLNESHEEAAALKVHHEQLKQEEAAITSDEEGAI